MLSILPYQLSAIVMHTFSTAECTVIMVLIIQTLSCTGRIELKYWDMITFQGYTHLTPSSAGRMRSAMQNGMYRRKYDTRGLILPCRQKS